MYVIKRLRPLRSIQSGHYKRAARVEAMLGGDHVREVYETDRAVNQEREEREETERRRRINRIYGGF